MIVMKFLYNKECRLFQCVIKINPVVLERYTFSTKFSEEIFLQIKDIVASNIKNGIGRTRKLVQARVYGLDNTKNHSEITRDQEKNTNGRLERKVTDIVERPEDVHTKKEKKNLSLLDVQDKTERNFRRKSSKARSKSARMTSDELKHQREQGEKKMRESKSKEGNAEKKIRDSTKSKSGAREEKKDSKSRSVNEDNNKRVRSARRPKSGRGAKKLKKSTEKKEGERDTSLILPTEGRPRSKSIGPVVSSTIKKKPEGEVMKNPVPKFISLEDSMELIDI